VVKTRASAGSRLSDFGSYRVLSGRREGYKYYRIKWTNFSHLPFYFRGVNTSNEELQAFGAILVKLTQVHGFCYRSEVNNTHNGGRVGQRSLKGKIRTSLYF